MQIFFIVVVSIIFLMLTKSLFMVWCYEHDTPEFSVILLAVIALFDFWIDIFFALSLIDGYFQLFLASVFFLILPFVVNNVSVPIAIANLIFKEKKIAFHSLHSCENFANGKMMQQIH